MIAQTLDRALDGLANGYSALSKDDLQLFLSAKFQNPLLGILALHLLLQRTTLDRDLITTVLDNLAAMIPDSPDVSALVLRKARLFHEPLEPLLTNIPQIQFPPMLAAGLQTLTEAAIDHPEIIDDDSILYDIIPQRYGDSPFTSWKPLPAEQPATRQNLLKSLQNALPYSLKDMVQKVLTPETGRQKATSDRMMSSPAPRTTGVSLHSITDWLSHDQLKDLDWIQEALLDLLDNAIKAKRMITIRDIAQTLHLPERNISDAVVSLMKAGPLLINQIRSEWPQASKQLSRLFAHYRSLKDQVQEQEELQKKEES
jgi:hypothetical protein